MPVNKVTVRYGVNIGLTDEAVAQLTDQQVSDIRLGATINFVCWFAGNTLLWSCKCCMLFLYSRIMFVPPDAQYIQSLN